MAMPNPTRQAAEHLVQRGNLAADFDLDAGRRIAGPLHRRRDRPGHAAEVRARDVRRHAHLPPHVVAVDFAGHGSGGDGGHVAHEDLARRRCV